MVIVFYVGYKVAKRTKVVRIEDMDVQTGRREFDLKRLLAEERGERRGWPRWKRVYSFFC